MPREDLADTMQRAYYSKPRNGAVGWLAAADAAIEALKPTATTPNDDERRKLWRRVFVTGIGRLFGRGYDDQWILERARTLADAALAADAEKWGAK